MTRKRFIDADRFVAALHAHRVAGDGFASARFEITEHEAVGSAEPNNLTRLDIIH
jgi:hypothetical protein